jgi:HSP20 family protein
VEVEPVLPIDPLLRLATGTPRAAFFPPVDVTVGERDLVVTMDVPGLTSDDLELQLADGFLSVRGERRRPEVPAGTRWGRRERPVGRFERRIKLPDGVDADLITATVDNGVLSLIVPKPERPRPRTIVLGSGGPGEACRIEPDAS